MSILNSIAHLPLAEQLQAARGLLKQLQDAQQAELRGKADVIVQTKADIEALLTARNVTLAQCFPKTRREGDGRGAVAVKFANGRGGTWAGRGKQPVWFRDAIAAGATPESLEVNAQASDVI